MYQKKYLMFLISIFIVLIFANEGYTVFYRDTSDITTSLHGKWKMNIYASEPSIETLLENIQNDFQTVNLPGFIHKNPEEAIEYYNGGFFVHVRAEIYISSDTKAEPFGLNVQSIIDSDKTYWNGHLIGNSGSFPPDFNSAWNTPRRYIIDESFIRYDEINTLDILMFCYYSSGINFNISLSDIEHSRTVYKREVFKKLYLNMFIWVMVLTIAVLFMIFYIMKRQKENLYFSLLSICTCFTILHVFNWELPIDEYLEIKICSYAELIVFAIGAIFWQEYIKIRDRFPSKRGWAYYFNWIIYYLAWTEIITAFFAFSFTRSVFNHETLWAVFMPFTYIFAIYYIYVIIYMIAIKEKYAWMFLFLTVCIIGFYIIDVLTQFHVIKLEFFMTVFSFPVLILTMSISLSRKFYLLYNEVERLLDVSKKLDRIKDDFLARTSHELRTPLVGIVGIAESLIDGVCGKQSESTVSNLKMIVSSGNRLTNLINDIIDYSALKNGQLKIRIKPVDVRIILDIVLTMSRPMMKNKNIKIIKNFPDKLEMAAADEDRLNQIFQNIISNAIKFTPEGSITIQVQMKDSTIETAITDTGIGIELSKQEEIFKSFEQVESPETRKIGGVGLGLAVTKSLVELLNGSIELESRPGQGSTFRINLPVYDYQLNPQSYQTQSQESIIIKEDEEPVLPLKDTNIDNDVVINNLNTQSKATIMVIDDEPVNLQVIKNNLILHNFKITEADNANTALEIIEKNPKPDLVLLDIMMPGISGYDVCAKIREMYSQLELPVILISAKNQIMDLLNGFDVGANDYIIKPFSKDELIARINTQLDIKNLNEMNKLLEKKISTIAAKIHNSIKNKLEASLNTLNNFMQLENISDERLNVVFNLLMHCSDESRNILFVMENKKCSLGSLLDEFDIRARLLLPLTGIDYFIERNYYDESVVIRTELIHNILEIYTETINNIYKHSEASKVVITIRHNAQNLFELMIRDDGKGFNYSSDFPAKGIGLSILNQLAKEIDAVLTIQSKINNGTTINLKVQQLIYNEATLNP